MGTRVQPQDSRIHCGLCLSRKRDFLPKRHFARVRVLFSPANTGSALTAVRRRCDSSRYGPQLLSCSTNNQGFDHPHGCERVPFGDLCCILHPGRQPRSFLESVRRQRTPRCTCWSSDILLDLGRLHANRDHGGRDQESTTDNSNSHHRRDCSSGSGTPRCCGNHSGSTGAGIDGKR